MSKPSRPLPRPKAWEYIRAGSSGVHGQGLFARADLPRGTYVMEYRGERVDKGESERRTDRQWRRGRVYVFELNGRWDIDGSPRANLARLANHSCRPNCEVANTGRRIWIVARRRIRAGEEVTYDYNFDFEDPPAPCRCGAARCRGYIVGTAGLRRLRRWLREKGLPVPAGLKPRR